MRVSFNRKKSLFVGTSLSALALFSSAVAAQAQVSEQSSTEQVIVTGTRVQGMTAADSPSPITVVGSDALTQGTGSPDVRQGLAEAIPSFNAQQFGGSFSNLTLSAALRGLSPNDTLVLVDGHRRHYSGVLHFDSGNFAAGSSAADLALIPESAIDHVEVLQEGAAAQYGTDAIAGVVNIILKKNTSGGVVSATGGQYYSSQGKTYDFSYNQGIAISPKAFINFSVEKSASGYTANGGADNRFINAQGQAVAQTTVTGVGTNGVATLGTTGNQIPNNYLAYAPNYPNSNPIDGNPEVQLTLGEFNAGWDINDNINLYANGTYGRKIVNSYQVYRLANQITATAGSSQPCTATNPNGYNTAKTATGAYACAVGIGGGVTVAGNNGLNAAGQVLSSGNAGNLFSSVMTTATGAALPSATGTAALGTQPELVLYPGGFQPFEQLKEADYQYNAGLSAKIFGWAVDGDIGYGKDIDLIYTKNSGNRSLFIDTHTTPTDFYDGKFSASQFTGTIDATKTYNIGLASPLTVAIGGEAREDTYGIGQGDIYSYYKEGVQARPGFLPAVAGVHSRKNYAGYFDLAVSPVEELSLDLAGRAEHYTDFGDTQIGKFTARYDFSPRLAVRGTISSGFRAPTLAEEFYTNTSVSPTSASVQLPADSAAAKVLGLSNLRPENSVSYSAGIVAHPFGDLSVTVDGYSIAIGSRITTSSAVTATGGSINAGALVTTAINTIGITLDPTATTQSVTSFLNALSTVTQGVDLTVSYPTDLGQYGNVNWTLAGNYNQTTIGSVAPVPAVLLAANPNATFFTYQTQYNYAHSVPQEKVILAASWSLDEFGATIRETYWGPQHSFTSPNSGGELITANQAGVGLTDIELRYRFFDDFLFSIGGDNVFSIHPGHSGYAPATCPGGNATVVTGGSCAVGPNQANGEAQVDNNGNVINSPLNSTFNPNGGYYYARVSFDF